MLTGDNQKAASYVAEEIGIDQVFAEMLPKQKSETVDTLHREGRIVAMTGGGATVLMMRHPWRGLIWALLSVQVRMLLWRLRILFWSGAIRWISQDHSAIQSYLQEMIQNLAWATGYNMIALPLAAGVLYNVGIVLKPAVGAVLMSLSTVIVAINARLLKIK